MLLLITAVVVPFEVGKFYNLLKYTLLTVQFKNYII